MQLSPPEDLMPRTARRKSSTDIYHVMIRGNNKQKIFLDDADRLFFLKILRECRDRNEFDLYAYCLMSNHVHMLIKTRDIPLEHIFKRVGTRYAIWFNRRHNRVGHLFQDRFKSECVEDERYFLTVFRYILQNPVKAGLENRPELYRWSSYSEITDDKDSITNVQTAVDIAGSGEALVKYVQTVNDDVVMEMTDYDRRVSEKDALATLLRITGCRTPSDFGKIDKVIQRGYLREMIQTGLSIAQISKLTGLSKSTVFRAK